MTFRRFPFTICFKKLQVEKLTYLGVPMKKADEEFDPWTLFA